MPSQEIPEEVLGNDGFLAGRFISPHSKYGIAVDGGSERLVTDQRGFTFYHKDSDPIIAQFEQTGLREHEIEAAFERWTFSGLPEGVNPVTRIAVYDPEAMSIQGDWSKETRKAVERKLFLASVSHPGDLAFVPSPRAARPWPKYDTQTPAQILKFQEENGFDPEAVRTYEAENKNRKSIIDPMTERQVAGDRGYEEAVAGGVTVDA